MWILAPINLVLTFRFRVFRNGAAYVIDKRKAEDSPHNIAATMATLSKPSRLAEDIEQCLANADDFDFSLILAATAVLTDELAAMQTSCDMIDRLLRKEEANRRYREKQKAKRDADDMDVEPSKYPSWESIRDRLSNKHFRKKYRMTKAQFELLCKRIAEAVGEKEFRPQGSKYTYGMCGEMRVAIGLRMLCGGSYLDLIGRAYEIDSPQSVYSYFEKLIDWLQETFEFPLVKLLKGLEEGDAEAIAKLREMSHDFGVDSEGAFIGCIGALDGLAIRIRCPTGVSDPSNYFCRKCFYALNVQVSLRDHPQAESTDAAQHLPLVCLGHL